MGHIFSRRWPVLVRLALMQIILQTAFMPGMVPHAYAQVVPETLPGPADANRISPQPERRLPPQDSKMTLQDQNLPGTEMPEGADQIHLTLNDVVFENVNAFTASELRPLYAEYLGKDITLDKVYGIAGRLTKMYRERGYFLSMAYVPDQKIGGGIVRIAVVEGRISEVEMQGNAPQGGVLSRYVAWIQSRLPVKSDEVESFLLRLNDVPGYDFRAVLSPLPDAAPGAVKLVLVPSKEKGRGQVSFDNFGSRYLGPNELSVFYSKSLLPMSQTSVSALVSAPADELRYFTAEHSVLVAPDVRVKVAGNITRSTSGYRLKNLDIRGDSSDVSAAVEWQPVRQRDRNVVLSFTLERRNTETELLETPFSKDRVRAARAAVRYDGQNYFSGYDFAEVTMSRGLPIMGASRENDPDVSRPEAEPDFSKLEARITHLHDMGHDLVLSVSGAGQVASGPMYASEEFGYGGQSFGRAYDSSEITGDHGIAAAAELQYNGLDVGDVFQVNPYVFYDVGRVWNEDAGQPETASGASAGLGVRGSVLTKTNYNLGLAYPLTRTISAPVYGSGEDGPRMYVQVNRIF